MKIISTATLLSILICPKYNFGQMPTDNPKAEKILLPNGWSLSPVGKSLTLGDLPLNIQISPKNRWLAVTNNGQSVQSLQLFDPKKEIQLDEKKVGKSWYGIKFNQKEDILYASGSNDNWILANHISSKGKFTDTDTIRLGKPWPKEKICPTGIDIDDKQKILYTVTKEDNTLYVIDLNSNMVSAKIPLEQEAYSCLLSPDKSTLYISLWGGNKVAVFDTKIRKVTMEIPTESHPNELLFGANGKYLFVANANDNSVSVIDARQKKVIETISTSLYPTRLTGSTTNGLALSPDSKTLYIANADNNCLAVFDVSLPGNSHSLGFIPTGWYPTNVKTLGNTIIVANGKGFSSLPNPHGPQPIKPDDAGYQKGSTAKKEVQYIGGLFKGTLSFIEKPNDALLKKYSAQVYENTPFTPQTTIEAKGVAGIPIPRNTSEKSPIKYVFYIIKENRTYDQVLGDMPEGNGDSSLCLFNENVTPNHHALAREFVLLDNFYVDAEVSADGHNWSTAAYATDYVEKTWPTSYGGRGGTYDYEGTRKVAYPRDGFIWDYCKRAGVSYRSYGEFAGNGQTPLKTLEGHICPNSPGFDLDIKDVYREEVWQHDFDSLLAINAVPQFSSIRISNDHTSGQRKGKPTPIAAVADNDQAIGLLVEHLSKSPIWKESAVFILEDDAQNGPDHVDAHRSPALVISPYIKKGTVNHHMYSTSGILRTMELILGLPPMSQYDAAALPLYDCFAATPDTSVYIAKSPRVDIDAVNPGNTPSAALSEKWNFKKEDSAPDLDLNKVVWKSVKGENSVMPAPRRSAFVKFEKKKKDDDD